MKITESIKICFKKAKEKTLAYFKDRKKRKKFVISICVVIIVVIGGYLTYLQYLKKNAVAIVNGEIITLSDLKEKISTYPEFYQEYVRQFPQQALEDFIGEKLLMQ
ncbi:MAG: SurA N-terminal domain-containing protein, partial [bacterium]|nr:SurA N-terminal domain-containing protein [bacterium]